MKTTDSFINIPERERERERENVINAYRFILGREPENEEAIASHLASSKTIEELRHVFLSSAEFRQQYLIKYQTLAKFGQHIPYLCSEHSLGFKIWGNLQDEAIFGEIINNSYENEIIHFMKQFVKTGDTVLDIGANIGFFSMVLSQLVGKTGKVLAFEPLTHLYESAIRSQKENNFTQLKIFNVALSDTTGEALLIYLPNASNWGGSYLAFDKVVPPGHASVTVPIKQLSEYVKNDEPISFVKIDVEGAEPLVLASFSTYLKKHRPVIISEVHSDCLRRVSKNNPHDFINQVCDYGYTAKQILADCTLKCFDMNDGVTVKNALFLPK